MPKLTCLLSSSHFGRLLYHNRKDNHWLCYYNFICFSNLMSNRTDFGSMAKVWLSTLTWINLVTVSHLKLVTVVCASTDNGM